MLDLKANPYYRRLSKLILWPLVILVVIVLLMVAANILILYFKYIPEILIPVEKYLTNEQLLSMQQAIGKIVENLSLWLFILMTTNISLIYIIWNVKKFLADLEAG